MKLKSLILGLALAAAFPLFAHEEHCHEVGKDGKLKDLPQHKSKADCEKAKGKWAHHHSHCHKPGTVKADGHIDASDEASCLAKGGAWTNHHDNLGE